MIKITMSLLFEMKIKLSEYVKVKGLTKTTIVATNLSSVKPVCLNDVKVKTNDC
jgi:hypothetical protein